MLPRLCLHVSLGLIALILFLSSCDSNGGTPSGSASYTGTPVQVQRVVTTMARNGSPVSQPFPLPSPAQVTTGVVILTTNATAYSSTSPITVTDIRS